MYFKGRLSIDPSQLTKIDKVSPASSFKKMLFGLTGGQFADKKEIETFKAMNILQQIHGVFNSNGINNIIRLTHDDIDIYHDTKGEKNDLDFAMNKYLIEISVNRSHQQHEYPIDIVVSGMIKEFSLQAGETREGLKVKMESLFKDQESYNMFITTKKLAFEQFLESLRFETMKFIKVDDIKMDIKTRMVIHKDKKQAPPKTTDQEYHGMPYGYFGFGDLILFSWLWSEMSFDHNMHISDVDLISDGGEFISSVGEEGIDAADASIMDYNEDFDARTEDFDAGDGGMDDMDIGGMDETIDTESSKGWFDDVFDGDFDLDFGDW